MHIDIVGQSLCLHERCCVLHLFLKAVLQRSVCLVNLHQVGSTAYFCTAHELRMVFKFLNG